MEETGADDRRAINSRAGSSKDSSHSGSHRDEQLRDSPCHLRNLGNSISITLKPDEQGYIGRECPVEECRGYFKITRGTGITEPAPCHCPYCGHVGDQDTFFTHEQIDYARSVGIRKVLGALHEDLKALEFDIKPRGAFGIGISIKVRETNPLPISHYRERQLE